MKNIKIFPKDWLQVHPYTQSTPVDSYYTRIANRIYDILEATDLINSFDKGESEQIAIRLAAYFEDVISQTNIWRTFITDYKARFGHYLPFYTTDDHYYDDEVNYEDIRLILWHFTQQYHGWKKGTFVNPDNPANEAASHLIYELFCEHWTTAPENERMQRLFSKETRYDTPEKYDELLSWFHYSSYLFCMENAELTEAVKEHMRRNPRGQQDIMTIHGALAHVSRHSFLAYTSPYWLSRILPEDHPDYEIFRKQGEQAQAFVDPMLAARREEFQKQYEKFKEVAGEDLLIYMKSKEDFRKFMKENLDMDLNDDGEGKDAIDFAVYATPEEGIRVLTGGVQYIKDPKNPFYDEEKAKKQALGFFIVKHCSTGLLKELMSRGMLADAQTKSLDSPERGKSIIQDNWQFLCMYFLREDPEAELPKIPETSQSQVSEKVVEAVEKEQVAEDPVEGSSGDALENAADEVDVAKQNKAEE